jgi:hypothetical protein
MVKKKEIQELEMTQQHNHQQLTDTIADLQEARKRGHFITSEAPWQAHVTETDGQGAPMVSSTRRRTADCECFKAF